jgi:hypothetical protein
MAGCQHISLLSCQRDTIVVDVTNFNPTNWLLDHANVSFHSDKLHQSR